MLEALVCREKNGRTFWTKIGAAFPNRDGVGYTLQLDANPIDGKIILRPRRERQDAAARGPAREPGDDDISF